MRKSEAKDIDRRLQDVLAECRSERGLTQVQLAKKLGKPQSFVSKYETGERKLTVGDFVAVCRALDTDFINLIKKLGFRLINYNQNETMAARVTAARKVQGCLS
jgi:transcriptional regulator with XRE-family HTH domain